MFIFVNNNNNKNNQKSKSEECTGGLKGKRKTIGVYGGVEGWYEIVVLVKS